jgi:MFS family permease
MAAVDSSSVRQANSDRPRLHLVFSRLMLALLLAALDQNIVTAFMVASSMTTPLYGKLSDIFGRKRPSIVSVLTFLADLALCGLSRSMTELIVFRAVQDLGAGA